MPAGKEEGRVGHPELFDFDFIAQAIESCHGNVFATAKKLNTSRRTIYNYLERYPELEKVRNEARDGFLDKAESILYRKVEEGETTPLIFYLKTQGRHRGWSQSRQVEIKGNLNVRTFEEKENEWKDILQQWREEGLEEEE